MEMAEGFRATGKHLQRQHGLICVDDVLTSYAPLLSLSSGDCVKSSFKSVFQPRRLLFTSLTLLHIVITRHTLLFF